MKGKNTFLGWLIVLPMILASISPNYATTIISAQNGNWNLPATWVGGAVPTAADDVIIYHTIDVMTGDVCNDLTVETGGLLQNKNNSNRTLAVNGHVVNNGTINYTNYVFTLKIKGDITNNGTWLNSIIQLDGVGVQTISCAAGKEFGATSYASAKFEDLNNASGVVFATSIIFRKVAIDLNDAALTLTTGTRLSVIEKSLSHAGITGNNAELFMGGEASLQSATISDITLYGKVNIGSAVISAGNLVVADTMQNLQNAIRTLTVNGNITNNGVVKISNYSFNIKIAGNLINNGIWRSTSVDFTGLTDQSFVCQNGNTIDADTFTDSQVGGNIILSGDLNLKTANVDLNGDAMYCNGHKISLRNGAKVSEGNFYDAILGGVFQISTNSVYFFNTTQVADTLQNNAAVSNSYSANINGNLVNNGVIRKATGSYGLNVNLAGNFECNGYFQAIELNFIGNTNQNISAAQGIEFILGSMSDTDNTSPVILNSDITVTGANIDLNNSEIHLSGGNLLMKGGTMSNTIIEGNNKNFWHRNAAHIQSTTVKNTNLRGVFMAYTSTVFQDVTVVDTLQNWVINAYASITSKGNFTNNGKVLKSNTYGFDMDVEGDIVNNGYWQVHSMHFTGFSDQNISCQGSNPIISANIYDDIPTSKIIANGNVCFLNTAIDLNKSIFDLQSGNLNLEDSRLIDGTLLGNGRNFKMHGINSYTDDLEIRNAVLMGEFRSYFCTFENVTSLDTLRGRDISGSPTIVIKGTFTNEGKIIPNNTFKINFDVLGAVVNNGYWDGGTIKFVGYGNRWIGCMNDNYIKAANISVADTTGDLIVTHDFNITLSGNLNFFNKQIFIPKSRKLSINDGYIINAAVVGDSSEINMQNNAYIYNSILSNVYFTGTSDLYVNVELRGNCGIRDILENALMSSHSEVIANANITNKGIIRNRPSSSFKLDFQANQHVYNDGQWKNRKVDFKGTSDQDIYLLNNKNVGTLSTFYDMITGATTHQWYRNDTLLTGKTLATLVFDSIMPQHRGYYRCNTNLGQSRTIKICTPVDISLNASEYVCFGDSVMLSPEPLNGWGPFTYSWSPTTGISDPNIANPYANPTETTTYQVTITDKVGCSGSAFVTVEVKPLPVANAGADVGICYGFGTTLNGSATGGMPEYTYLWSPATGLSSPLNPTPLASPLITTTYTFTVTDAYGCKDTDEVTVTVNPLPTAYPLTLGGHFCEDIPAAVVEVNGSEIGVNYYLLRNGNPTGLMMPGTGEPLEYFTSPVNGIYTVRGVNTTTGCVKMMTGSIPVIIDEAPLVYETSPDVIKFIGETVTLFVHAVGTEPLTYQWFRNGDTIPDATSSNYIINNITWWDWAAYTCKVGNNCGIVTSDGILLEVLSKQTINIPAGWSGFSTYQTVYDPVVTNMFAPIANELAVMNDFDHVYSPLLGINTYGNWDHRYGAQIKMLSPVGIEVAGVPSSIYGSNYVTLNVGWNYLPVLSSCNVSSADIFNALGSNLKIVKDIAGSRVYWPEYNIYTLNTLEPGKAYFIKIVDNPRTLNFPECTKSEVMQPNLFRPNNTAIWNEPVYSPVSHTIAVPKNVAEPLFSPGDVCGVFTAEGYCAGFIRYEGQNLAISAFADDPSTAEKDGFVDGEAMNFKMFKNSDKRVYEIAVVFDESAQDFGWFKSNGISVLKSLETGSPGVIEATNNAIRIYPNPTHGIIYIEGLMENASVEIMDVTGATVYFNDKYTTAGIDLSGKARGIYSIRIVTNSGASAHKVLLK